MGTQHESVTGYIYVPTDPANIYKFDNPNQVQRCLGFLMYPRPQQPHLLVVEISCFLYHFLYIIHRVTLSKNDFLWKGGAYIYIEFIIVIYYHAFILPISVTGTTLFRIRNGLLLIDYASEHLPWFYNVVMIFFKHLTIIFLLNITFS